MNRREFLLAAAGAPFALSAAPALGRRAGGTPLALVTADAEASIVAFDLATGRVRRRLGTVDRPRSIEGVNGEAAVVAHTEHGVVSVVDAAPLRVRRVVRGFAEPRYTAVAPGGRLAYVSDSRAGEIAVLDVARARILHRTDVGGPARHLSVDAGGRWLWVSLGTKARSVAVLDLARPARPVLAGSVRPPFLAHDVGFGPDGRVWVTSGDRGAIALYDATSRRRVRTLAADAPPQHVTFARGRAYVTSGDDGTLRVHALGGRRLAAARIPVGSYNVQEGWGVVLAPSLSRGTLCVVDGGGRVRKVVRLARSSHDACVVIAA